MELISQFQYIRIVQQRLNFFIFNARACSQCVVQQLTEDSLINLHIKGTAPKRPYRIIKVGPSQVGPSQVAPGKVGLSQVDRGKVGLSLVGPSQVGRGKVCFFFYSFLYGLLKALRFNNKRLFIGILMILPFFICVFSFSRHFR